MPNTIGVFANGTIGSGRAVHVDAMHSRPVRAVETLGVDDHLDTVRASEHAIRAMSAGTVSQTAYASRIVGYASRVLCSIRIAGVRLSGTIRGVPTVAFGAIDPHERAVVQRAQWLRRNGYSLRHIAQILNREGHHNRRGGLFQHNQVYRMLRRDKPTCVYE
jgi:hypothetical protein